MRQALRKPKKKSSRRVPLAWAVFSAALAALAAVALLGYRWFATRPGPPLAVPVAVSWPAGLDASEAAQLLADLGLTDQRSLMAAYLLLSSAPACAVAGPHLLHGGATPAQLRAMLCRSDRRTVVKVIVPEGFDRFTIAKRLERLEVCGRGAFLHASADRELLYSLGLEPRALPVADTAEGYLFPATYAFRVDSSPAGVVQEMVRTSQQRWDQLVSKFPEGLAALRDRFDFGRHEALILASMVEKEAAVAEERSIIASVFLNRLRDPRFKHLQSDPTGVYGCVVMPARIAACKDFDGRATPAINRDRDNLYSTYSREGLPPGPIANPGRASIRAVLAPAESEYLFFVAKGGGKHAFSVDYAAHQQAVRRLREMRRPRAAAKGLRKND